jgi:glycosyltransferase involved in cell wall biosynthesis
VVRQYTADNHRIDTMGRLELAKTTLWSSASHRDVSQILADPADVAHFHNTFPLVSPAAYYAAARKGAAVVQTLHNYRLLCPNAVFFRDGRVCEDCLGKTIPWPGVVHACYRQSRTASAGVAGMLTFHRGLKTSTRVDVYIALTEFARRKFIQGGIPEDRIVVKPNFVADPGIGTHEGRYVLFVGRLAPEKGIETLIEAWRTVRRDHAVSLKVVGSGPSDSMAANMEPGIEWLGWRSQEEVVQLMKQARILVFPSRHYEGLPVTIIEAFATGLPVAGSAIGSVGEVIVDGQTGRLFPPGDAGRLADILSTMLSEPEAVHEMGCRARSTYEANYTPARNYRRMMDIYDRAMCHRDESRQLRKVI